MNVGVFLPNWVGDVVMATPMLRALRRHYGPDTKMIGIMRPIAQEVLRGTNWIDEVILFDRKSADRRQRIWSVSAELRRKSLDVAILLTNSLGSAAVAWLGGARQRIGYVRNGRGWLLNRRLHFRREGRRLAVESAVDVYLKLAHAAGCESESRQLELGLTDREQIAAADVFTKLGFQDDAVVVLNTGGSYGGAKHWPREHFATLARMIAEAGNSVLIVCGPAERENAREIEQEVSHARVRSLANEQLSIGLTKACIARSRLLVTTDSGPRHFAPAFQVPVITLFGNKDPAWTETYFDRAVNLRLDLPCMPCGKRECPLIHHQCMRDLSPEMVFAEVQRQMSDTVAPAA